MCVIQFTFLFQVLASIIYKTRLKSDKFIKNKFLNHNLMILIDCQIYRTVVLMHLIIGDAKQ